MTAVLVVLAVGAGSYLFRISMVLLLDRTDRRWIERATAFVVPAAFAALATGGILAAAGHGSAASAVPPLAAVAVAAAAVRLTGTPAVAIAAGMPTLWLLTAVLPA